MNNFQWSDPNWGWLFLGMVVGLLVHAALSRIKG